MNNNNVNNNINININNIINNINNNTKINNNYYINNNKYNNNCNNNNVNNNDNNNTIVKNKAPTIVRVLFLKAPTKNLRKIKFLIGVKKETILIVRNRCNKVI